MSTRLIFGAWTDELQTFAAEARNRVLIATPWIKYSAAQLLLQSLPPSRNIVVQLIARFEIDDFLSGSSDLHLFYPALPAGVDFRIRMLRNLHAKMFIRDTRCAIVGSANLTEGGLFLNQEALILSQDITVVSQACDLFEQWWQQSAELPSEYFKSIHQQIEAKFPSEGDEPDRPTKGRRRMPALPKNATGHPSAWVPATGAEKARACLSQLRYASAVMNVKNANERESARAVLDWLERHSRFVPSVERESRDFVDRFNGYIHHADRNVRATAIDRVGRMRISALQPTLRKFLADRNELPSVRAASAFALTLLADPSCFADLVDACAAPEDIARWARRGCFMLLSRIDSEQRQWFLQEMSLTPSTALDSLLAQVNADTGTNSQRLAKATVLEMLITGVWNDESLDLIAFVVHQLRRSLSPKGHIPNYPELLTIMASMLRVHRGDLRHGLLSFAFIRSIWAEGWPVGLLELFGPRWNELELNYAEFTSRLNKVVDLAQLRQILTNGGAVT
jgi:hypothetical protein